MITPVHGRINVAAQFAADAVRFIQ